MNEEASSIGKTDVKCAVVLLLGIASFSCCIAAEFKKVKVSVLGDSNLFVSFPKYNWQLSNSIPFPAN
ncbi:hypothetical protein Cni_G04216 [Canna indica]|uniref:Uncharacterized protein n=1 Tax=Canna indica TaxID=4628 RepID=A0AAQ3JSK0_9LILI|nr:hypothetical protein Cni_G04216 [Canna indica]